LLIFFSAHINALINASLYYIADAVLQNCKSSYEITKKQFLSST